MKKWVWFFCFYPVIRRVEQVYQSLRVYFKPDRSPCKIKQGDLSVQKNNLQSFFIRQVRNKSRISIRMS